jgi:nucleotide-binding universal stress UspA family protein
MNATQPVVVGIDFSGGSEAALVRAADLAERFHAPLHLLHAQGLAGPRPSSPEEAGDPEHRVRAFAAEALGSTAAFDAVGPTVVVRRLEPAVDAIPDYASDVGAGLIVVGTHGRRGVRHLLMGSVAEGVVRHAPCPVLVVPNAAARTAPSPSAPVLVPVDFTERDRDALAAARFVAAGFGALLELVHITPSLSVYPSVYDDATGFATALLPEVSEGVEVRLRTFDATVSAEPAAAYHTRTGQPAREIVALAEDRGAGLIVMATRGHKGWAHAFIGSVTEETLRRSPCPVLTLHDWDGTF